MKVILSWDPFAAPSLSRWEREEARSADRVRATHLDKSSQLVHMPTIEAYAA
jgi:hypothetical protein